MTTITLELPDDRQKAPPLSPDALRAIISEARLT